MVLKQVFSKLMLAWSVFRCIKLLDVGLPDLYSALKDTWAAVEASSGFSPLLFPYPALDGGMLVCLAGGREVALQLGRLLRRRQRQVPSCFPPNRNVAFLLGQEYEGRFPDCLPGWCSFLRGAFNAHPSPRDSCFLLTAHVSSQVPSRCVRSGVPH